MLPRDLDKIVSGETDQDPMEVIASDIIAAVKAGDAKTLGACLRDLPDLLDEPAPQPKVAEQQPQADEGEGMAHGGAIRMPSVRSPKPHLPRVR